MFDATSTLNNSTVQINTAEDLIKALPQAGNFLGCFFGWSIEDNADFSISHEDLVLKAEKFNVPTGLLPNEIKTEKAVTSAVTATQRLFSKQFKIYYTRKPKSNDTDKRYILAIVKKRVNELEDLEFEQKCKIIFYSDSNQWISDNPSFEEVLNKLVENYQFHQNHTVSDIRYILRSFVGKYAIRLNPEGKSYFVPAHYMEVENCVKELIKDLDKRNRINYIPIFSTPEGDESIAAEAVDNLEKEIENLEKDIENFLTDFKCSDKVLSNGLKSRKEKMEEIKTRIQVFSTVLNFKTNQLNENLQKLSFLVDSDVSELQHYRMKDSPSVVDSEENFETDLEKVLTSDDEALYDNIIETSDDVGF